MRQTTGRGPPIWAIFAIGGLLMVATEALSLPGAAASLESSLPVLVFLLTFFLFVGALERSGALEHLAHWLIGRARTPADLPLVLFVGFGVCSAFLINDALVLIAVPLLLSLARRMRLDPKPLLLTVAYALTVGSVLTPLGNPQNLLVALSSGIEAPMAVFLRYLLIPVAASLLVGGLFLRWAYGSQLTTASQRHPALRASAPRLLPSGGWGIRLRAAPVLALFPATVILLVALDAYSALTGAPEVPIWITALGGALVLMAVTPGRVPVLRSVDVRILVLFAGLFVVVAGAVEGGVIGSLEGIFPIPGPGFSPANLLSISATSLLGPQLVSNVPWVALQIPVLQGLGYGGANPIPWLTLASVSTLAGNVTLLGAASNLILVERAERLGVRIRLGEFMRYGLPVTAISVLLVLGALLVGL